MKHLLLTTIAAVLLVGCGPNIHQAVTDGEIALIRRELSNGADVNQKNEDGYTPLHLAVKSGHKRIVELLISKGADVNAKDARGWTSLDYSIELNEMFGGFGDNDKIESIGITETITLYSRNEDGSENPVTVNNTKIKEIKEIADLLRKHGGKTGEELKAEGI